MSDIKAVTITAPSGRQRVVEYLEQLLEYAKQGKVNGLVVVTDEENSVGWAKINVTYPMALGMLLRAEHHIQREWDGAGEKPWAG